MATPRKALDVDYLVTRYKAGLSFRDIADEFGVCWGVVRNRVIEAGVSPRPRRSTIDAASVALRYRSGVSEKQLADELGVSRSVISRRLAEFGTDRRGRSDAERLKWSRIKTDRAAVVKQCSGAWSATRGRIRTDAEVMR